ncbi:hypothetical protein I4U23_023264 [Adineta vaga]|nr:hypothetical protein I4U23_023264 [Adineta vaga]
MKKPSISQVLIISCVIILLILLRVIHQSGTKSIIPLNVNSDCEQSLIESDGFICESKSVWYERKNVFRSQDDLNVIMHNDPVFFATNWEPTFHCSNTRRIGARGDGGKWICDPHQIKLQQTCLIYSVGSNGDFSFETEIKKLIPHCEIHAFDQNLYSCPTNICTFHRIVFGNGNQPNNSKSWQTIIQQLNHTDRLIDILKIDIEGSEYDFFPLLFQSQKSTFPRQILVEVHPVNKTIIEDFFNTFRKNSYVISNKENNLYAGAYFFEYSFLKLNPLFFR